MSPFDGEGNVSETVSFFQRERKKRFHEPSGGKAPRGLVRRNR